MNERSRGEISRRRPGQPSKPPERKPWEAPPERDGSDPAQRVPGVTPEGRRPDPSRDEYDDDGEVREHKADH